MLPIIITADRKVLEKIVYDLHCSLEGDYETPNAIFAGVIRVIDQIEKQLNESDLVCPLLSK